MLMSTLGPKRTLPGWLISAGLLSRLHRQDIASVFGRSPEQGMGFPLGSAIINEKMCRGHAGGTTMQMSANLLDERGTRQ